MFHIMEVLNIDIFMKIIIIIELSWIPPIGPELVL